MSGYSLLQKEIEHLREHRVRAELELRGVVERGEQLSAYIAALNAGIAGLLADQSRLARVTKESTEDFGGHA